MLMAKGKLIVFEGLDGSGKGTQIRLLAEKLRVRGVKVYETAEPTQSSTGGIVRDALAGLTPRTAYELSAMFLADRIFHNVNPKNGIAKYIEEGVTVICDRYYYSSFAYQGIDADLDWVMGLNLDCREIMRPDMCIFLDVDTKECDERISSGRLSREIYENVQAQEKIRRRFFEVFDRLKDRENIRIIDASGDAEKISQEILKIYNEIGEK